MSTAQLVPRPRLRRDHLLRITLVAALAVAALLGVSAPPATAAAGTVHGCPRGAVCVYPEDKGWNGDHPSLFFYSYGAHNLSDQFGGHMVFNNQYVDKGHWPFAYLCNGYDGRNPDGGFYAYGQHPKQSYGIVDLGSVNSILLK